MNEHPTIKFANKLKMQENINKAPDLNDALFELFSFFLKTSFTEDHQTRASYASKFKELGYSSKEIKEAVDNAVIMLTDLPSFNELRALMPQRPRNASYGDNLQKIIDNEATIIASLRKQFKELLCDNDDAKYQSLMTKIVRSWLMKVMDYTEDDLNSWGKHGVDKISELEKCVLFDWRDSGFNPALIFETGRKKRFKGKSQSL